MGTNMVTDISPGPISSKPSDLTEMNGTVLFVAEDAEGNVQRRIQQAGDEANRGHFQERGVEFQGKQHEDGIRQLSGDQRYELNAKDQHQRLIFERS